MNDLTPLRFRFSNKTTKEQQLCLEPWGDFRALAPGTSIVVVISGEGDRELEIEVDDAGLVIYGSNGDVIDFAGEPQGPSRLSDATE